MCGCEVIDERFQNKYQTEGKLSVTGCQLPVFGLSKITKIDLSIIK